MKSFFPTFFASCLGVFAAFALCLFVIIAMGISGMSKTTGYSDNTILKLKLEEFIPEKTDNVSQQSVFMGGQGESIGLRRILKLLEAAAADSKISGIVLENNSVAIGQASILSLMQGFENLKKVENLFILTPITILSHHMYYVRWLTLCL
ncbi:MAG: hypothetical protein IPO92_23610 [Saprospiraceae bacterium]|nr:hypothetical protein [Saprospiraceae bacterium]